jgi:hypothetical protein
VILKDRANSFVQDPFFILSLRSKGILPTGPVRYPTEWKDRIAFGIDIGPENTSISSSWSLSLTGIIRYIIARS